MNNKMSGDHEIRELFKFLTDTGVDNNEIFTDKAKVNELISGLDIYGFNLDPEKKKLLNSNLERIARSDKNISFDDFKLIWQFDEDKKEVSCKEITEKLFSIMEELINHSKDDKKELFKKKEKFNNEELIKIFNLLGIELDEDTAKDMIRAVNYDKFYDKQKGEKKKEEKVEFSIRDFEYVVQEYIKSNRKIIN